MTDDRWRHTPVLAWTDNDGPGRPPATAARWLLAPLTIGLAVAMGGIVGTDALCPDHRAWVNGLALFAAAGSVAAVVGLIRGSFFGMWLTLLVALDGVAIGLLDALHDPTRGRLIAVAFGVIAAVAAAAVAASARQARWEAGVRRAASAHPAMRPVQPRTPADVPDAADASRRSSLR